MDTALLYLVPALCIAAVLAIGAALNSGPKHPRHAAPRHLAAVPDPPEVGSMILAEERNWRDEARGGMVVVIRNGRPQYEYPAGHPDWREQTMAELSPEALGGLEVTLEDPGPGDAAGSSSPASPGPDHIHNGSCSDDRCWDGGPGRDADWLETQMADLFAWVRTMHESRVTA